MTLAAVLGVLGAVLALVSTQMSDGWAQWMHLLAVVLAAVALIRVARVWWAAENLELED